MPVRHQPPRFREHEKQKAIDDGERFVEQPRQRMPSARVQAADEMLNRLDDAKAQRAIHGLAMPRGRSDHPIDQRSPAVGAKGFFAEDAPEDAEGRQVFDRVLKVEFQIRARVRALRIDKTPLVTVRAEHPRCVAIDTAPDRIAPECVERCGPGRGHQHETAGSASQRRVPPVAHGADAGRHRKPEPFGDRGGGQVPDGPSTRGGSQP